MCGIFAALSHKNKEELRKYFDLIQHRGPDASEFKQIDSNVIMGFHRLAINDLTSNGMQPLVFENTVLVCNGEIFNYKTLINKYGFVMNTGSDCEIILHLYNHFGRGENALKKLLCELEAEFAFILYDGATVMAARDIFGVRPLFYSNSLIEAFYASELKALAFLNNVTPFPPGSYKFGFTEPKKYYEISLEKIYPEPSMDIIHYNIRQILEKAVRIRLMSDRPMGCCLSGGLDSSLITAIVSKYLPNLECFSIGLNGGVDIEASKKVVTHLNANGANIDHHIVNFTVAEGFHALRNVIWHLESRCVTTIRAGVCNYLLAKYIKENTNIKVLYSGSGSDEILNGYQYGKMIIDTTTLENDSARLLNELYMYDNLRDDRVTAAFGLELRVPFLDPHFINYIFAISPKYRMSNNVEMEKLLLRDSFKNENLLPKEILYRRKEAFSNGIDSNSESWYKTLTKKYIEPIITDSDFNNASSVFPFDTPKTKESYYYRKIFEELFPRKEKIIPKIWLPPSDIMGEEIIDPSATVLICYQQ